MPECPGLQRVDEWHPLTGAWGSLFETEAYYSQGAEEAAEVGGWGTFPAFPMHLIDCALVGDSPPAALREVERRVKASKLSVLERDPHDPVTRLSAVKPCSLGRGASLQIHQNPSKIWFLGDRDSPAAMTLMAGRPLTGHLNSHIPHPTHFVRST